MGRLRPTDGIAPIPPGLLIMAGEAPKEISGRGEVGRRADHHLAQAIAADRRIMALLLEAEGLTMSAHRLRAYADAIAGPEQLVEHLVDGPEVDQ